MLEYIGLEVMFCV